MDMPIIPIPLEGEILAADAHGADFVVALVIFFLDVADETDDAAEAHACRSEAVSLLGLDF